MEIMKTTIIQIYHMNNLKSQTHPPTIYYSQRTYTVICNNFENPS
jgi:hypothetical protein